MLTGIDKNEQFEYVSSQDKSENPTKFMLACLPARQRMSAIMKFENGDQITGMCEIVRSGVAKIIGLKVKGEVKDFDVITDEVIDMLPVMVIKDLFVKILAINSITEEEAKN
jgi:hypothetical protein